MTDLLTGNIPASPASIKKKSGVTHLNKIPLIGMVVFTAIVISIAAYALMSMAGRQNKVVEQASDDYSSVDSSPFVDKYLAEKSDGNIGAAPVPPSFINEAQIGNDDPIKQVSLRAPVQQYTPKPKVAPIETSGLNGCGITDVDGCASLKKNILAVRAERARLDAVRRTQLEEAANGSIRVNFNRSGDPELGICDPSDDGCGKNDKEPVDEIAAFSQAAQGNITNMMELLQGQMGAVGSAAGGNTGTETALGALRDLQAVSGGNGGAQRVSMGMTGGDGTRTRQQFLNDQKNGNDEDYLSSKLEDPRSEIELKAGTIIRSSLITGINSDLPGQVIAQVSRNVWDTIHGEFIVIPQGTKVIGVYDSEISYGQKRVLVAWTRLIYPNGQSLRLDGFQGYDTKGNSGFKDQVNNHYMKTFSSAVLFSVVASGVAKVDNDTSDRNQIFSSESEFKKAMSQEISRLSSKYIGAALNVSPTLTIRQGYRMNIMIDMDIVLPAYDQMHRQFVSRYVRSE